MALDFQTLQIPLVGGMNTGTDPRALNPPALAACRDVSFDDAGGLRTRPPFAALATDIFGGGDIADTRRIVANGDELLLFTKDTLYSWNAALSKWVSKGTHLAIAIDEEPRFVTTGDQILADRAELDGTIVYAWWDQTVYVAAIDKTTGSVLMAPTVMPGGVMRPRVVALETRILLVLVQSDGFIVCYAMDPADPATALAGSSTTIQSAGIPPEDPPALYYDVVKREGADSAFVATTTWAETSYNAHVVTSAPAVTSSTKARTCDGPIAVASHPAGTHVQVLRTSGTDVKGDYLTAALADVYTTQAIGSAGGQINQVTGAFRSTTDGGYYRCYTFWSAGETTGPTSGSLESNWTNTNNAQGTEARVVFRLSLGSRAFERDGRVYVHGLFSSSSDNTFEGPQLQNTYFLFRDDAFLCGKAVASRAGGFNYDDDSRRGILPGVALVDDDTYAWCGTERRTVPLGDGSENGYAAIAPTDVLVSFDDDRARRCARLGRTLYVTGAEVLQYDGQRLTEVGFHVYPWSFGALSTGAGTIPDGTYTYKQTYRWDNARGDRERSTTALYDNITISGGPYSVSVPNPIPTDLTHKTGYASEVAVELWRTQVNPGSVDAPMYLVTSRDPAEDTGDNRYINNTFATSTISAFTDDLSDAELLEREQSEEVGTILEKLSPRPAQIIIATQDRMFLAGVAGDPDRVWYSRLRGDGEVASFNEALTIPIPRDGGRITGLAILSETLVVFRERATYVVPGEGYANDGSGQNFGPARILSADCGAESQEAIARTDLGLVFKGAKGWYVLGGGWSVQYIGEPVRVFDDEPVLATHVLEASHQVRVVLAARMLVWDYLVNQWSEWTVVDGAHACVWQGQHAYLSNVSACVEASEYTALTYGMDVETPWIKLNDLQGRGRVRWMLGLGEWRSAHRVRICVARDYETGARLLDTTTDLDREVTCNPVSGGPTVWTATLEALEDRTTIRLTFVDGSPASAEVRDHYRAIAAGSWSYEHGTVGVLVISEPGAEITVAEIEAALAGSSLVRVATPDTTPAREVNPTTMEGSTVAGEFPDTARWFDDVIWNPTNTVECTVEQFRIGPSIQRCQAMKLRITAIAAGSGAPPTGEALRLTGLGLEVGIERGLNRRLTAAQKAG